MKRSRPRPPGPALRVGIHLLLPLISLAGAGCGAPEATPTIAVPVAPVAPGLAQPAPLPDVRFVDITASAGIDFTHDNCAFGAKLLPETMGSGVAFLDYDRDGDPDLLFVNSALWPGQEHDPLPHEPTPALYRNDGTGHFADVTRAAGLDFSLRGMGVATGDFDNDGDPDLYLTALGGGRLLRNDDGRFVDITEEAHAGGGEGWQSSAAFFDMDNDGDLDLFICNYVVWSAEIDRGITTHLAGRDSLAYDPPTAFGGTVNCLLRNDQGVFTDVTQAAGIPVLTPDLGTPMAKSLAVAPYDIDEDGLCDLAVANDTVPNLLYHNRGGGRFEEVGIYAGVAYDQGGQARGAMGMDWADFRGDGSLGLAIANFANEMMALYVCDDPSALQFSDRANLYGLGGATEPPLKFGIFFFDYDLDGRPDLLSVNGHLESDIELVQASQSYRQSAQLFWNSGRPGRELFIPVGPEQAGPDLFQKVVGRGSSYADIDGDGDLDVAIASNGGPPLLLRNEGGNRNGWIRLQLLGNASNRGGLGARVEVTAGGHTQKAQLFTAKSYLSAVEDVLSFGLGSAPQADQVTIHWPSGAVTRLSDLASGQLYRISESPDLARAP